MIVSTDNLWEKYGRLHALRGLSIKVPEGSVFTLLGSNGAGKTTTIKILMNLIQPTTGTAMVLGVDSRKLSSRELAQIGYVSENQKMPGNMTVMAYISYLRPFYPRWDHALECDLLPIFGLPPERKIKNLSHGMRMKMALICALSFRPRLLVLDEPLSGLDPLIRDEFMGALKHKTEGMTVIISSHELAEIEEITTDVAFLDRGQLLFQEAKQDLKDRIREVRATLEMDSPIPSGLPSEWLNVHSSGNVLSFVDTQYSEMTLASRITSLVGGVRNIEVRPVPLRSIFTILANSTQQRGT